MSRPHLIVDGYNVVHAGSRYLAIAETDMDLARERLVVDTAAYAGDEYLCSVVFDGGGNPASDGTPHRVCGVAVIFSATGTSADDVVESLAARARDRGVDAIVVTSDGDTRRTVAGGGVAVMDAGRFIAEVEALEETWRSDGRITARRSVLGARIDARTRESLARWARGEPPDADAVK